jgi:AbrB family looped-hinge helix DNA binding protein
MASRSTRAIGIKDLAARLKMKEKQVRRYLRSMAQYDDGVYTRYEWTEGELPSVAAAVEARSNQKINKHKTVVTSKGQLVIPAAIRRRYHIKKGTEIHIEEVDNGILLRPVTDQSIERVRGILAGMDLPDRIEKETDRDIR